MSAKKRYISRSSFHDLRYFQVKLATSTHPSRNTNPLIPVVFLLPGIHDPTSQRERSGEKGIVGAISWEQSSFHRSLDHYLKKLNGTVQISHLFVLWYSELIILIEEYTQTLGQAGYSGAILQCISYHFCKLFFHVWKHLSHPNPDFSDGILGRLAILSSLRTQTTEGQNRGFVMIVMV